MEQLEGFEVGNRKTHVCLLKKSLYDLKQAPKQWYKKFNEFMLSVRYKRFDYDWCVYYNDVGDGVSGLSTSLC